MTERNELDRDDLEQLMTLLSEFDCVALEPNLCGVDGRLEWLKQEHKSNAI